MYMYIITLVLHVHVRCAQAQPRRTLPTQVRFETFKEPFDPYPSLYHMLSSVDFLECLFLLLSSPATANHSATFAAVKDVLVCLMNRSSGLKYLCAHYETVNGIMRALTQTPVSAAAHAGTRNLGSGACSLLVCCMDCFHLY